MNRRRGFKRLAIALGVPYFAFWALVAVINYNAANDPSSNPRAVELAYENLGYAIMGGIIVPTLLLVFGGLAYWVYCGFKPQDD